MLISVWSRLRSPAAWALAVVVMAPAAARAQQTGLFPLLPIRRERVPCEAEDSVYRLYREQYYGYYPTCWRRFPPGWGAACPNPEAPNPAESFTRIPRGNPPPVPEAEGDEPNGGGMGPDEPAVPPGGANDRAPSTNPLPAVPRGNNPFDMDMEDRGNPAAPRTAPPPSNPPDLPPPGRQDNRSTPPTRPSSLGPLPGPLPGPSAEVGLAPQGRVSAAAPGDALLALPEPPATEAPAAVSPLPPVDIPAGAANDATPPGRPEQAPQRRSLLGSLFGGLRRR
jgi:hypothetical protein